MNFDFPHPNANTILPTANVKTKIGMIFMLGSSRYVDKMSVLGTKMTIYREEMKTGNVVFKKKLPPKLQSQCDLKSRLFQCVGEYLDRDQSGIFSGRVEGVPRGLYPDSDDVLEGRTRQQLSKITYFKSFTWVPLSLTTIMFNSTAMVSA